MDPFEVFVWAEYRFDGKRFNPVANSEEDAAEQPLEDLAKGARTLRELTSVLGLFRQPAETADGQDVELVAKLMELLIEVRTAARQRKDFEIADTIRNQLTEIGITLEDRKDGTGWRLES